MTLTLTLTNSAIMRVARMAAVVRMSRYAYEDVRGCARRYIEKILTNALKKTIRDKRKTVQEKDVRYALKDTRHGPTHKNYQESKPIKTCLSTSSAAFCFSFPPTAFVREVRAAAVVREVRAAAAAPVRFSGDALAYIQMATEIYLVKLLTDANMIKQQAGRQTLFPKDIQLALHLMC
jgi:histone H3/H4